MRLRRVENVTAIATASVALLALAVSLWQGYETRQHNRLSVRPRLVLTYKTAPVPSIKRFGLSVQNRGLGPAILHPLSLMIEDELIGTTDQRAWRKLVRRLGLQESMTLTFNVLKPTTLMQGDEREIFAIDRATSSVEQQNQFFRAFERLNVGLCYCSLYGECWQRWATPEHSHSALNCPPGRNNQPPEWFDLALWIVALAWGYCTFFALRAPSNENTAEAETYWQSIKPYLFGVGCGLAVHSGFSVAIRDLPPNQPASVKARGADLVLVSMASAGGEIAIANIGSEGAFVSHIEISTRLQGKIAHGDTYALNTTIPPGETVVRKTKARSPSGTPVRALSHHLSDWSRGKLLEHVLKGDQCIFLRNYTRSHATYGMAKKTEGNNLVEFSATGAIHFRSGQDDELTTQLFPAIGVIVRVTNPPCASSGDRQQTGPTSGSVLAPEG